MTESERQIGFKFSLNEQKLSQQNTWWVHAHDAYCPITQACIMCTLSNIQAWSHSVLSNHVWEFVIVLISWLINTGRALNIENDFLH